MELLKTIAMLCQLYNGDTTDWNLRKQQECQAELAKCVLENKSPMNHYDAVLLKCVAERKAPRR